MQYCKGASDFGWKFVFVLSGIDQISALFAAGHNEVELGTMQDRRIAPEI